MPGTMALGTVHAPVVFRAAVNGYDKSNSLAIAHRHVETFSIMSRGKASRVKGNRVSSSGKPLRVYMFF